MIFHIAFIFLVAQSVAKASECEATGLPEGDLSSLTVNGFARFGYQDDGEFRLQCGGTIIEGHFLITAALCLMEDNVHPYATVNIVSESGQTFKVAKAIIHPKYNFPVSEHDIGIVKLLENGKTLEALKDTTFSKGENLDGKSAVYYGYGSDYTGNISKTLKTEEVQVMANPECFEWLSHNTTLKIDFINATYRYQLPNGISVNMICTKGFDGSVENFFTGPCKGDTGGPLFVLNDNGSKTFEGIISGGILCGKNIPKWYTRVSKYAGWIQCVIGEIQKKEK